MNKLLTLFLLLPFIMFGQVPQGVGYQGVATDSVGIELINQSISIRSSVLSGSATGAIEWQETHITTTDTFGLFNLSIGQGTNTGNGAQTSFADISWGANTHFLKIEMDVNGGTNYSFMGTNQLMSVPYALYAENANINYDSISTLLSNDSTFITTVSGGIGGGCDFKYPDGLEGDPVIHDFYISGFGQNPYTVPSGKTLYINNLFTSGLGVIYIDGIAISEDESNRGVARGANPFIVSDGQVISSSTTGLNSMSFNGFLVNTNVMPITYEFYPYNSYTVPSGKNLYINNLFSLGSGVVYIDGIAISEDESNRGVARGANPTIIISSGQVISSSALQNYNTITFNGYLVDENYFADCGGGGSSSSTVDSSYIDSLVQFYSSGGGGGCDLSFPNGFDGEPITESCGNNTGYTVPAGKELYLLGWYNGTPTINSKYIDWGNDKPLALKSGDILESTSSQSYFNGLLLNESTLVLPITESCGNNTGYTVPAGKELYLLGWYNGTPTINSKYIDWGNGKPLALKSGDILESTSSQSYFNGYLVDENYFADCGGGGSSSSTIDSSYIDSLVQYYVSNNTIVGCNIDPFYPDGMEGIEYKSIYITNSTPYTVPANKTFYLFSRQTNLYLNGNGRVIEYDHFFPIPIAEGNVLSLNGGSINGYLIDKGFEVKNYLGGDSIYIVPNDMYFYVLHNDSYINVDGITSVGGSTNYPSGTSSARAPLVFQPGSSISSPYGISGLLIPTDYCNQGGSSGSGGSTNNNSGNGGGGCDFLYPEGFNGEAITHYFGNGNYTVPTGKRLYLLSWYNGTASIDYVTVDVPQGKPLILNSGQLLSSPNLSSFNGYLVDENYFADCGGGSSVGSSSSLDSLTIISMINNITNSNQSIGIGDYFQGGVVGYVFQTGDLGYIAGENHGYILYSDNTQIDWGCMGITTNVINNTLGQGPNNTNILDSLCPESNFAAKWCNDLVIGPYNDWFLPNYYEATLIEMSFYLNYIYSFYPFNLWLSEEFSSTNSYGYNNPNCTSNNNAFSLSISSGNYSLSAYPKNVNSTGTIAKVVAFREF